MDIKKAKKILFTIIDEDFANDLKKKDEAFKKNKKR